MKIYPLKAHLPICSKIENQSTFINGIKDNLKEHLKSDDYSNEQIPSFYVYSIKKGHFTSLGLVALTDISDDGNFQIIPHEAIIEKKKDFLIETILNEKVIAKPIMVFIDDENQLNQLMQQIIWNQSPSILIDLGHEGIHEIFRIDDLGKINELENHFKEIQHCFVADGHHRLSTLNSIKHNYNQNVKLLLAIFSKNDLQILGYHRLLQNHSNFELHEILDTLRTFGKIEIIHELRLPLHQYEVVIASNKKFFSFMISTTNTNLVGIEFASEILDKIFSSIKILLQPYHPSSNGTIKPESHEGDIIFYLYPIGIDKLIEETKSGRLLPPKSTWFEPKVRSGLIIGRVFE